MLYCIIIETNDNKPKVEHVNFEDNPERDEVINFLENKGHNDIKNVTYYKVRK